jgi:hypothetical protein
LYLVRHADAGLRSDSSDDHLRALTVEGQKARTGARNPPRRRGREVVTSDELVEGVEVAGALGILRSLPDGSVVCTHGDMLTKVVAEFEDARDRNDTAIRFDKGVVWVLSREQLSLSLVDEIGPSNGPDRRDERIPHVSAAVSAHSRSDDRRSMSHG